MDLPPLEVSRDFNDLEHFPGQFLAFRLTEVKTNCQDLSDALEKTKVRAFRHSSLRHGWGWFSGALKTAVIRLLGVPKVMGTPL